MALGILGKFRTLDPSIVTWILLKNLIEAAAFILTKIYNGFIIAIHH